MPRPGNHVVASVTVDVEDMDEAKLEKFWLRCRRRRGWRRLLAGDRQGDVDGFPVGVECPVTLPRICGRFQPAARRQDVRALVTIDISGADPVAVLLSLTTCATHAPFF